MNIKCLRVASYLSSGTINVAFSVPVADEKVLVPKKSIGALHVPHHVPIDALVEPAAIYMQGKHWVTPHKVSLRSLTSPSGSGKKTSSLFRQGLELTTTAAAAERRKMKVSKLLIFPIHTDAFLPWSLISGNALSIFTAFYNTIVQHTHC